MENKSNLPEQAQPQKEATQPQAQNWAAKSHEHWSNLGLGKHSSEPNTGWKQEAVNYKPSVEAWQHPPMEKGWPNQ